MHNRLQRAYELSLQAGNDPYSSDQKEQIQAEVSQILREIDRTAETANYSNQQLFSISGGATAARINYKLRCGWLEQAETVVVFQGRVAAR